MGTADTGAISPLKKRVWKGHPAGRWITSRKIVQYTALFVFIALFVGSRSGRLPASLVNLPMRLDPLLVLANLLASRTFIAGSALALILVILTLIFGRAWCGWLCPLGTTLDLFSLKRWRGNRPAPPESWRGIKYFLLLTILVAALFGNLTLLVFDPLALLMRSLAASIWPAVDQTLSAAEAILYKVPFMEAPVSALDSWLRPIVLPTEPVFYRSAVFFAAFFLGVIALNLLAQRFWCRYLCPLGGLPRYLEQGLSFPPGSRRGLQRLYPVHRRLSHRDDQPRQRLRQRSQ